MTDQEAGLHTEQMILNMGPSHPATHGTVKFLVTLDGETVVDMDVEVGYLHRGFEKQCESVTWGQVFPYTDRLNYNSAIINNVGYALAVEKLLSVEISERCSTIRVLGCELARLADHYTNIAAAALELGAMSAFIYLIEARELIWDLLEKICGARLTSNYIRIGGLKADLPPDFKVDIEAVFKKCRELYRDFDKLLTKNRIFLDRMRNVGGISAEEAISYGFTGPCLRACGVEYDVRKSQPYLIYDQIDFEIPVGTTGDNFDRYLVRMEEIKQSMEIVEQCIERIPDGPVNIDDPHIRQAAKEDIATKMEELIQHFIVTTEGVKPPKGEVYFPVEGANGELGFYLVSDGGGKPLKCRVRSPSFLLTQAMPRLCKGSLLADIIPTFDQLNMIGGECDR